MAIKLFKRKQKHDDAVSTDAKLPDGVFMTAEHEGEEKSASKKKFAFTKPNFSLRRNKNHGDDKTTNTADDNSDASESTPKIGGMTATPLAGKNVDGTPFVYNTRNTSRSEDSADDSSSPSAPPMRTEAVASDGSNSVQMFQTQGSRSNDDGFPTDEEDDHTGSRGSSKNSTQETRERGGSQTRGSEVKVDKESVAPSVGLCGAFCNF